MQRSRNVNLMYVALWFGAFAFPATAVAQSPNAGLHPAPDVLVEFGGSDERPVYRCVEIAETSIAGLEAVIEGAIGLTNALEHTVANANKLAQAGNLEAADQFVESSHDLINGLKSMMSGAETAIESVDNLLELANRHLESSISGVEKSLASGNATKSTQLTNVLESLQMPTLKSMVRKRKLTQLKTL